MRISDRRTLGFALGSAAALGLGALAVACSGGGGGSSGGGGASGSAPTPSPSPTATASTPAATSLTCATNGALTYTSSCTMEFRQVDGDRVLVVRHADGSFRRFIVRSGPTLEEADGAQRAVVLRTGDTLEVTLGSDRYRLNVSQLANAG